MHLAHASIMVCTSERAPTVREGQWSLNELLSLAGVDDWAESEPQISYLDESQPTKKIKASVCAYRAGDSFGPYRLVRPIGCGGMGSVWVAHHRELDAEVAIKLLRSDMQEPAIIERFLIEARLLARIDHPAVVQVLDFGYTDRAAPFLVMELLNGQSLYDALHGRERLTAVQAVRFLLPIAHGLAAVHGKKIVHRDLKPDNIFLAEQDHDRLQPKLVDFGVARSLVSEDKARLTLRGGLLGSPQYMAPEQARGDLDIDHRADVWAFCAVLYECVAGHSLFPMEDTYERVLRRILEEKPTPLAEHGVDEPELWKIIEQGLRRRRERRWQSMDDLGTALAYWLRDRDVDDDVTGASLTSCWIRNRPSGEPRSQAVRPPIAPPSGIRSQIGRLASRKTTRGVALAAGVAVGLCLGSIGAALLSGADVKAEAVVAKDRALASGDEVVPALAPLSIDDLEKVSGSDEDTVLERDPSALRQGINTKDRRAVWRTPAAGRAGKEDVSPRPAFGQGAGDKANATRSGGAAAAVSVASSGQAEREVTAAVNTSSVEAFYGDLGF